MFKIFNRERKKNILKETSISKKQMVFQRKISMGGASIGEVELGYSSQQLTYLLLSSQKKLFSLSLSDCLGRRDE